MVKYMLSVSTTKPRRQEREMVQPGTTRVVEMATRQLVENMETIKLRDVTTATVLVTMLGTGTVQLEIRSIMNVGPVDISLCAVRERGPKSHMLKAVKVVMLNEEKHTK